MRDSRLIRSRKQSNGKIVNGIFLKPLGNRTRYIEFEDAVEERDSLDSYSKFATGRNSG